ncbi:MAG: helix-turn-helix domain-containing protein [Treponemataceae bacterium]|nr:helix-turn-helix domain-containing protein [Treponemataceae bacterium]
MKEMDAFSERVRELMKKNRYSQKQLCELCGVTEAAFSRYMAGVRLPKADTLANLANALGTTSDYLLGRDSRYGYEQLKILLASSKDDLSKNQKDDLMRILMDEYRRQEED